MSIFTKNRVGKSSVLPLNPYRSKHTLDKISNFKKYLNSVNNVMRR